MYPNNLRSSLLSKYNMPPAKESAHEKHNQCEGKFKWCNAKKELVEIEIGATKYKYCTNCANELNQSVREEMKKIRTKKIYSTQHYETEMKLSKNTKDKFHRCFTRNKSNKTK